MASPPRRDGHGRPASVRDDAHAGSDFDGPGGIVQPPEVLAAHLMGPN